jgi:hypothetical protein
MANEKRLIDANELVRFCENEMDKYKNGLNKYERDYAKAICVVKKIARTFPTVDAVEVVRCKDCRSKIHDNASNEDWCNNTGGLCCRLKDDYFCPFGERKDNEID